MHAEIKERTDKAVKILIIDGQGGGIGKSIIEQMRKETHGFDGEIVAAGTNSAASASMLRAGADIAATGENAVIYNSKKADIIAGAVGICFANSMRGEISPAMAAAVCESDAVKILIPVPMYKCNINIMGVAEKPMAQYISEAVDRIKEFCV